MPRLVSLSRAAKLVGISRGEIQKRVHDQELISFEGQVKLDDIERLFPEAELEDNHFIEDLEKIIEQALKRARGEKLATLLAPDPHTLAVRLKNITSEHVKTKTKLSSYIQLVEKFQNKFSELISTKAKPENYISLNDWLSSEISKADEPVVTATPILLKDTALRVMAAQVHVLNSGHEFFVEGNNSILEGGLSAGLALNYGCSNGNCGNCKAKLISGEIKKIKPHDYTFSESEKAQNYFLCCSNTAITEVEIEADEAGSEKDIPQQKISAKVKKLDNLSNEVLVLNLKTPRTKRLRFLAGQNVILSHADLPPLEIPIASCPCDDMNIQFHIPYDDSNHFINYVSTELKTSDSIMIEGPTGHFVLDEDANNPVIFIAFDTGFAPIKSLIEHAVTLEHAEFIHLYWLHNEEKPYMHNQCRAWADALDNFKYDQQQCDIPDVNGLEEKLEVLINEYKDFSEKKIYICGDKDMVQKTERILLDHNANKDFIKTQNL
ncbi:MAG: 2Fe-2S iron-sulfur cluster-binding protein [Woeseiaceae bacterium]